MEQEENDIQARVHLISTDRFIFEGMLYFSKLLAEKPAGQLQKVDRSSV